MLTRTRTLGLLIALTLAVFSTPVSAALIDTTATGTFDGDSYSYLFTIEDDPSDSLVFHAELTNTSPANGDPLIDLVAFNMLGSPVLGVDFNIVNVTPNWAFSAGSGGVQFDYLGEASSPFERIMRFDSLTFDIVFVSGTPSLDLFLLAPTSFGTGIGGDNEEGQVAVRFANLGEAQTGTDLLTSNWERGVATPEPGVMILLATGLLGVAGGAIRRRRT